MINLLFALPSSLFFSSLALAAGCSGSTSVADPAAELPAPPAVPPSAPLPSATLVSSQIAITITGHLGAWQTRDGSWMVQVPAGGAQVLAYWTTQGSAGAMLNVRGTNSTDVHGNQVALPLTVVPCDALVVASTGAGRGSYWAADGRSACDEMAAFVFVPYAVGPGLIRPPAIGNSYLSRYFRSVPIPEVAINLSRLPSVVNVGTLAVNWSAWGAALPDIGYLHGLMSRFCGECYDGWSTDTRTPDHQHPGYGTYTASVVSQALVQLCSTASPSAKYPLAYDVVQWGLDLAGAWADGRRGLAVGGHCAGRKALIIAAGHLLGVEPFANPNAYIGPQWQEDNAYFVALPSAWWFGSNWIAGWRFNSGATADGSKLAFPPSTWGDVNAPQHDTWAWMIDSYMAQVVGAQVGTALAMRLMGREGSMGLPFARMVEQWLQGPSATARNAMVAVGVDLPWGNDYSIVRGAGFCKAAALTYW